MPTTVFFSWQTDRPAREGRNLIERALEAAVHRIGQDTTIEEAVRDLSVDRDTKDVPGSPPIVDTILKKINAAAIFVPDLTFVATRPDGRPTPNPNVLIEYGWALNSLGHLRMMPVLNTAYGDPTAVNMPFDLAHLRRPILYHCPPKAGDEERKAAKDGLAKELESALRTFLSSDEFKPALPKPAEFAAREASDGFGRFRAKGDPIGQSVETYSLRSATDVMLSDAPALWLRVMPGQNPRRQWLLTELEAAASPQRGGKLLMPLSQRATSYDFVRAADGFGCYALLKDPATTNSVSFAFTTGEVWGVDSLLLGISDGNRSVIPNLISLFADGLTAYADFLSRIGMQGPYRWIAGMEGLKNRALAIAPPPGRALTHPVQGSCITNVVMEHGLHNIGDSPRKSLQGFFAKLYDNCGLPLPEWYAG